MSAIKRRHQCGRNYIYKIVEEYGKLIRLQFPSDIENDRILEIMELAVYDKELDNLINQEDKKYAEENDLIEDDYFYNESSSLELDKSTPVPLSVIDNHKSDNSSNLVLFPHSATFCSSNLENKKRLLSFNIRDAIPCIVAVGILTCVGIAQFCHSLNHHKDPSFKLASTFTGEFHEGFSVNYASNYFLSNANNTETEKSICNSSTGRTNEEIKQYYISFKQLKNQIVMKQLQPLEVKGEVRELQVRAERQQREAEKNQRYWEAEKELAEVQHNYDEAQRLKDQAKTALSESRQWHCLSQQALNLSIR